MGQQHSSGCRIRGDDSCRSGNQGRSAGAYWRIAARGHSRHCDVAAGAAGRHQWAAALGRGSAAGEAISVGGAQGNTYRRALQRLRRSLCSMASETVLTILDAVAQHAILYEVEEEKSFDSLETQTPPCVAVRIPANPYSNDHHRTLCRLPALTQLRRQVFKTTCRFTSLAQPRTGVHDGRVQTSDSNIRALQAQALHARLS